MPRATPLPGPPKDAHQSLPRYPLVVERGLLYIDASTQALVEYRDSTGQQGFNVEKPGVED